MRPSLAPSLSLREGLGVKCYLSDKAVWGGVRWGASIWALKSALPLGVLSLKVLRKEKKNRKGLIMFLYDNYLDIFLEKPCFRGAWQPLTFGAAFVKASEYDQAVRWSQR